MRIEPTWEELLYEAFQDGRYPGMLKSPGHVSIRRSSDTPRDEVEWEYEDANMRAGWRAVALLEGTPDARRCFEEFHTVAFHRTEDEVSEAWDGGDEDGVLRRSWNAVAVRKREIARWRSCQKVVQSAKDYNGKSAQSQIQALMGESLLEDVKKGRMDEDFTSRFVVSLSYNVAAGTAMRCGVFDEMMASGEG